MTLSLTTAELRVSQTSSDNPLLTDCKIVHAIPGRLRISLPQLVDSQLLAEQLEEKLQSLSFVTDVKINSIARSIVIYYTKNFYQDKAVQQFILETIQGKDPLVIARIALEELEQEVVNFDAWSVNEIKTLLNGTFKDYLPTIGRMSLILGIVGFILPLVPGTPFLLFSSFCFSMSDKNETLDNKPQP